MDEIYFGDSMMRRLASRVGREENSFAMIGTPLIPATQYLRMSTDEQKLSLTYQAAAIQRYAQKRGFVITSTYEDSGKSGLTLKRRKALMQLLQDVVSRRNTFEAVLVYDVSRWGRFQDTDESAHYEFLCKSAGVPVHYSGSRWFFKLNESEIDYLTLICRCAPDNKSLQDFYLMPRINTSHKTGFWLRKNDPWLTRGKRVRDLSLLRKILDRMLKRSECAV